MSAPSDLCTHARKGRLFARTYEVYGKVHRDTFFDPTGTRAQDDRERIADVQACGWRVLVVHDTELARTRWRGTVAKVARFLDEGRGEGPG